MDFSVGGMRTAQEHESRTATNQPFACEQGRNLLKGRTFWNENDLGRQRLFRRNDGFLSPMKDLIGGRAETDDRDQQKNQKNLQFHESILP